MKTIAQIIFTLSFIVLYVDLFAQDAPTRIAIVPFTAVTASSKRAKQTIQEEVTSSFVDKSRFFLLSKNQTEKLRKDLEAANGNEAAYDNVIEQKGRLAGVDYIITGVVDSVVIGPVTSKNIISNVKNVFGSKETIIKYRGKLNLVLQINKVETGRIFLHKSITIYSRDFEENNEAVILENAECRLKNTIEILIRSLFAPPMIILSVDKEKKGLPDKVIVTGGLEMFGNGKQEQPCPGDNEVATDSKTSAAGSMLDKVTGVFHSKKISLTVFSIEQLTAGGKTYKREKVLGQLKVESIEADVAVCTVVSGAKEIGSYMAEKKTLNVKIEKSE